MQTFSTVGMCAVAILYFCIVAIFLMVINKGFCVINYLSEKRMSFLRKKKLLVKNLKCPFQ